MKWNDFARLKALVAEAERKKVLVAEELTKLTKRRDGCDAELKAVFEKMLVADYAALDEAKWNELSGTVQKDAIAAATALVDKLNHLLEDERESGWLMSPRLVGTWGIILVALFGLALTVVVLLVIAKNWNAAVGQDAIANVSVEWSTLLSDLKTLETSEQSLPEGLAKLRNGITAQSEGTTSTKLLLVDRAPNEKLVLRMVVYMGMLGGCLHFLGSLVRYVGDREFRCSWLPYYIVVPIQGGGLALLIYLLLRVGVLAPSGSGSGGIAEANLVGIYAFAGLTGMFAKAATEKLGEVFLTLFRTAKPAGDSVKDVPLDPRS